MDRRGFLQSSVGATLAGAAAVAQEEANVDPVAAMTERLNPKIQAAREVGLRILKPPQNSSFMHLYFFLIKEILNILGFMFYYIYIY